MTSRRDTCKFAALLLTVIAPMLIGATGLRNDFNDRVLDAQNRERARLGIAPMRWDPELSASAARWAQHLAAKGQFAHAPENVDAPEGENLWAGTKDRYSPEAMAAAWVREKKFFRPGVFPDNSTTGKVEDVGHYTQLMWRDTGQVGCALAPGLREDVLVCRYSAAGNYVGERPF